MSDYNEHMVSNPMQWMILDGGSFKVCGQTVRRLPAGAYSCSTDCYGAPIFQAKNLKVDDLIDFEDSLPAHILEEIGKFWMLGDRFKKYGFLHRRGYLLYGKQGCGKSSLIHQIVTKVVRAGNLAFFCEYPQAFLKAMEQFRKVEVDRPMVCIFEDIDAIIEHYGDSDLLQWLDGNQQVDRAVNIASTNYPEKLDRRIISRPRRFDRILRIESPDERQRDAYFARKMSDLTAGDRAEWVRLTEGLPFAALAEVVISVRCLGNDLYETVELLKKLDCHNPSSGEFANESAAEVEEDAEECNGVAR